MIFPPKIGKILNNKNASIKTLIVYNLSLKEKVFLIVFTIYDINSINSFITLFLLDSDIDSSFISLLSLK